MNAQRPRLLLLEDSSDDELPLQELRSSGYDISHTRAVTREEFSHALDAGPWDAIISGQGSMFWVHLRSAHGERGAGGATSGTLPGAPAS